MAAPTRHAVPMLGAQPDISMSIMTHPRRLGSARRLRDSHPELDLRIVMDPLPDGPPSPLRTSAVAWAAVSDTATHHLVLQDDVMLCAGFRQELAAAVRTKPWAALSFFTHWVSHVSHAVRVAALCGFTWTEVVGKYLPSVALLAPADVSRDMAAHLASADTTKDDVAIRQYLHQTGVEAYVAVAGLVEDLDLPSLAGHNEYRPLRAACFVGTGSRRQPHGWDSSSLRPSVLPYRDESVAEAVCFRHDPHSAALAQHSPICGELERYGVSVREIEDTVASLFPECATRDPRLPLRPVADLWSCAFVLGARAAQSSPGGASAALGRPLAKAGLSTLIRGVFRKEADAPTLETMRSRLTTLVRAAVRRGWAEARR